MCAAIVDTILDLITERETTATAGRLREQIGLLSAELTRIDRELAGLATTRSTLRDLAATEFTADGPTIVSAAYQQIIALLGQATAGMPTRDVCLALDTEPLPKHVEGARAKLKRLVTREVATEDKPGILALIQKQTDLNLRNRPSQHVVPLVAA